MSDKKLPTIEVRPQEAMTAEEALKALQATGDNQNCDCGGRPRQTSLLLRNRQNVRGRGRW